MRLRLKILLTVIVIAALLYLNLYLYIFIFGKDVLVKKLEGLTHKKVTVASLTIIPPLNLGIKNLEIEGLTKIDSIFISPSILGLLSDNLVFNDLRLTRPHFTYEKLPALPQVASAQALAGARTVATPPEPVALKGPVEKTPQLAFKNLSIKDGRIDLTDRAITKDGIIITVKNIDFSLTNLTLRPRSAITEFELKGRIPWSKGVLEGKIEAQGWFNLFKRDMQATLKISDIDGIYLYPYYSNWVDLEKARIEKAKLNFTSNLRGANNILTAECHLELADILRRPLQEGESEQKASKIADAVLGMLKENDQGKIVLDFSLKMPMDRPVFGFSDIRMAFEDKLAKARGNGKITTEKVVAFPGKVLETTIESATSVSKALINSVVSVGKEMKKAVEGAFKKEPPAPSPQPPPQK